MKQEQKFEQSSIPPVTSARRTLGRGGVGGGEVEITRKAPSKWVRAGKMRPMILLWALGVPIPLIVIFILIRGCM